MVFFSALCLCGVEAFFIGSELTRFFVSKCFESAEIVTIWVKFGSIFGSKSYHVCELNSTDLLALDDVYLIECISTKRQAATVN